MDNNEDSNNKKSLFHKLFNNKLKDDMDKNEDNICKN